MDGLSLAVAGGADIWGRISWGFGVASCEGEGRGEGLGLVEPFQATFRR
jgi:hypothetical protein